MPVMVSRVILPGTGTELLRREFALAFSHIGLSVSEIPPSSLLNPSGPFFSDALESNGPFLLFSVNFQGLYPLKPVLELLRKTGGRVAVWCVDNPWSLLSGVRDPLWKSLPLFVTDAGFIEPLRVLGAERVYHLPLAASPELFMPNPSRDAAYPPPPDLARFVFVGRSAFPGKERFFSGQTLPPEREAEARAMLRQGERPDLFWWERVLGSRPKDFWPGKKARCPALGAEEANLRWRGMCLAAAAKAGANENTPGLDLIGDAGWRLCLPPQVRLRPPVDYYARLPGLYRSARYSLCLTSLQLPSGLNQRHFDVWMAGGLGLTDATPGLSLFPEELVRPVLFKRAEDIGTVAEALERTHDRERLIADWRSLLLSRHTYVHRAQFVLEALDRKTQNRIWQPDKMKSSGIRPAPARRGPTKGHL